MALPHLVSGQIVVTVPSFPHPVHDRTHVDGRQFNW